MSSQSYEVEKPKTKLLAAHVLHEDCRGGPFLTSLALSIPWLVAASLQSLPLFMRLLPMALCPHLAIFHVRTPIVLDVKVKAAQLCPTLFDPRDYTVHGILQATGHLPNPGIEPRSPALQADSLPAEWVPSPYTCPRPSSFTQALRRKGTREPREADLDLTRVFCFLEPAPPTIFPRLHLSCWMQVPTTRVLWARPERPPDRNVDPEGCFVHQKRSLLGSCK